jgi:hypothetical protein
MHYDLRYYYYNYRSKPGIVQDYLSGPHVAQTGPPSMPTQLVWPITCTWNISSNASRKSVPGRSNDETPTLEEERVTFGQWRDVQGATPHNEEGLRKWCSCMLVAECLRSGQANLDS